MYEELIKSVKLQSFVLMAMEDAVDFVALDSPGMSVFVRAGQSMKKRRNDVDSRCEALSAVCGPDLKEHLRNLNKSFDALFRLDSARPLSDWLEYWRNFCAILDQIHGRIRSRNQGDNPAIWFQIDAKKDGLFLVNQNLRKHADRTEFMCEVSSMLGDYRQNSVDRLAPSDRLAVLLAYELVESGKIPCPQINPIRTDVLREFPTYLALADPGRGHLQTTVYDQDMLKGTIVHVETIDREGNNDRQQVEAYRIPSIRDVARIRVHVGISTPCSVYVGRPVFEGWKPGEQGNDSVSFQQSLLKAAHTVAAACSAMFYLGVAECKIGMDSLSYKQAVVVMKAIVGNVIRDTSRQRLSGAFNINAYVLDDRSTGRNPVEINERVGIAELAVLITAEGGFDKVTLDGAQDQASVPFLEQMKPLHVLNFVHKAHECGLETYISAGMDASNISDATYIGVGGVGMGIRMHEKNQTGEITHLKKSDVLQVLNNRNKAMREPVGQAASVLAKLDWLKSFDAISDEVDTKRRELFELLKGYHQLLPGQMSLAKSNLDNIIKLLGEVSPVLEEAKFQLQENVRRTSDGPDPIFAIALAKLRSNEIRGRSDTQESNEMVTYLKLRDAESLKTLMGYQ